MTYREFVLHTCKDGGANMVNAALGLSAEAGEVANLIKKSTFQGQHVDRAKILDELSDVRWYLELAAQVMGSSVEELERINREKLQKRFTNL